MVESGTTEMDHWQQRIAAACGYFSASFSRNDSLFIGEVKCHHLGDTEVVHIRSNASSITRHGGARDRAGDRFSFLVLQCQGSMEVHVEGEVFNLQQGDMALLDSSKSIEMLPNGLFHQVSIHLPKEKLTALHNVKQQYGKLSNAGVSAQLLHTVVQKVASGDLLHWAGAEDGEALQNALVALLQPVLQYEHRRFYGSALHLQGERLIKQHLGNLALSPKLLAEQLGISSRQLHRIFGAQNDTVCGYIRRARLDRAAVELLDPLQTGRTITEIAFRWGYMDAAHFSRVFKHQFSCSPREYRQTKQSKNISVAEPRV